MKEIKGNLFNLKSDKVEDFHPNFIYLMNEDLPFARDVIESWADGFIDRDNKFVKEFQTTFNSSFWELYLFAAFKELGFSINMEYDRPDFLIEGKEGFVVEASIASHPKDGTPEWKKKISSISSDASERESQLKQELDKSTLRLANTFISKSRKYSKSYKDLDHIKSKPYVIAMTPFDAPFTNQQRTQAIHRVLYGFDKYIAVDWNDEERDILGAVYMESIDKGNGSTVPLGYFTNPEHSHVSAVIFSNTATIGKVRALSNDPRTMLFTSTRYNDYGTQPTQLVQSKEEYEEELLDGMIIFHNPFADVPLTNSKLRNPCIAQVTYDVNIKDNVGYMPHGFLYERSVNIVVHKNGRNVSLRILNQHKKLITEVIQSRNEGYPKLHK